MDMRCSHREPIALASRWYRVASDFPPSYPGVTHRAERESEKQTYNHFLPFYCPILKKILYLRQPLGVKFC